jgi:adenine-specific DNA-methyltransferase
MGEYFDTVLKPRILKASYSKDWKDGKPVSREGVPQLIKYLTLESYEDTLNNLELRPTDAQQRLLDTEPAVREDYLLRYMLDFEARGSASLLDLKGLEDPFNYQLLVTQGGESRAVTVDLPETFSLLLGLRVARVAMTDGFLTVEGLDPDDARVLVIWRTLRGADRRAADAALDAFFIARGYRDRPAEAALDRVYVNGDNTLANLARAGDRWRVLLTEEAFQALMFAEA